MKNIFRVYLHPSVWLTHLLTISIAWLVPPDILERYQLLEVLANITAQVFPMVDGYGQKSAFPGVSKLYFALILVIAPIWVWRLLVDASLAADREAFVRHLSESRLRLLLLIPFAIVQLLVGVFLLFFNPGIQFNVMPINDSRLALGVFGPVYGIVPFVLMGGVLIYLRALITRSRS